MSLYYINPLKNSTTVGLLIAGCGDPQTLVQYNNLYCAVRR